MKLTTNKAKELLAFLTPLKVGDKVPLTGFMKGLSDQIIGHVVEVEKGRFWQLSLRWNSVQIQSVVAEITGDDLTIDVLGT